MRLLISSADPRLKTAECFRVSVPHGVAAVSCRRSASCFPSGDCSLTNRPWISLIIALGCNTPLSLRARGESAAVLRSPDVKDMGASQQSRSNLIFCNNVSRYSHLGHCLVRWESPSRHPCLQLHRGLPLAGEILADPRRLSSYHVRCDSPARIASIQTNRL